MICLLEGHKFQLMEGQGIFKGNNFAVCTECNKTVSLEIALQQGLMMSDEEPRVQTNG